MERDHQQLSRSDSFSFSLAGLSWPPPQKRPASSSTSYCCGYCKREFRSPQGLGGHMNVHRWDRAKLIHGQCSAHRLAASPPISNPSPSGRVIDPRLSFVHLPHCTGDDVVSAAAAANKPDICRFASASSATAKDFEVKNFESSIGVCSHDGTEDRVDLELRLGCS